MKKILAVAAAAATLLALSAPSRAATELTFYYPIAVGGPLTKVIDGYAAEFEKANPGVKVKPIYAGNYDDARIKALAALKAGQPAQISVLYSIDLYELIEQDVIVPWDDVATTADDMLVKLWDARTGKPVRELILRDQVLTKEQLDAILDPFEMTSPGIAGSQKKQERAWWEEELVN